jgi:hypothetical protein
MACLDQVYYSKALIKHAAVTLQPKQKQTQDNYCFSSRILLIM